MNEDDYIRKLAQRLGIAPSYFSAFREEVIIDKKILLQLFHHLGHPIQTEEEARNYLEQELQSIIEPVLVLKANKKNQLQLQNKPDTSVSRIELYSQLEKKSIPIKLKLREHSDQLQVILPPLPLGYYDCRITYSSAQQIQTFLIVAPMKFFHPPEKKIKKSGVFAPLYALHDRYCIGNGDLHTLCSLADLLRPFNISVFSLLPFFASNADTFSPYSPLSRLFWDELYLDLRQTGAFDEKKYNQRIQQFNQSEFIDYQELRAFKREILMQQCMTFFAQNSLPKEFLQFIHEHPEVEQYAKFRAQDDQVEYQYHLFCQWQFAQQLGQLKEHLNTQEQQLYLDLPIGSHPQGYDVTCYPDEFLAGLTIGAAPDPGFPEGQNWGLPPFNPQGIRAQKYHFFRQMLQSIMRHVDMLRIDHVMGLERIYCIPQGNNADEGTYLYYPVEELYAILAIESHRHQVILVGENLGTVSKTTEELMRRYKMFGMHILQYALDSKLPWIPKDYHTLAALNTHDMAPFAQYYESHPEKISSILKQVKNKNMDVHQLLQQSLDSLAQSRAAFFIIGLEDLWGEKRPQNIPGSTEYPNWQRKLIFSNEEMVNQPEVRHILETIAKKRTLCATSLKGQITEQDLYLFNEGTHHRLYQILGAHQHCCQGVEGLKFSVWAPSASWVSVIGNFNYWNPEQHKMHMLGSSGIWTIFIPHLKPGELYKFYIQPKGLAAGFEKMDPFSFYQEIPPKTASIAWESNYVWRDEEWLKNRVNQQKWNTPISIYEVHLGSWRRLPEEENRWLTYIELAPLLADYVKKMNYTHIELLPIMEHPFYGSWGYQTLGYFAPTARYGTPDEFKYFIDYMHQQGIGIILDWVPSHFPTDGHGLAHFDGTALFEHADPRQGFHPDWKSAIFNYGRHEVKAFLISSAMFWLDHFHIDGLRVDAVASMLYLDYSRSDQEWIPNKHGSNENLEAIDFLKELNTVLYENFPGIQIYAEESTAWPKVSRPVDWGGLGFGFKWDMGWMHDTLNYFSRDPIHRCHHQQQLTFRMIYAFDENFVLSLSHDEVVYGKRSLIERMPGDYAAKFNNLKLLYGYMFGLPGKKLMFMGTEFAQFNEWNHDSSLDWHLLNEPSHQFMQQWVRDLNKLYVHESALYEYDCEPKGFSWISGDDAQNSVFAFLRKSSQGECILVVLNCTPVMRNHYRLGVPHTGTWQLIGSSNATCYGGTGSELAVCSTQPQPAHNHSHSLTLDLPGLSALYYKWTN